MSSSSEVSDPMAIMSDDEMLSEQEVYTSDTTSTDDDDFQPFALPDVGVEPADGLPAGDLPLAVIPAPVPLVADPVVDMPLDIVSDDDVDLFEDDPFEGEAHIAAGDIPLLADAPAEEAPVHSPDPDSFESVASAHSLESDHDVDSDPVFPPGFGPDHDLPIVAPVANVIPVDDHPIVGPRDADTHNGWIDADEDYPPYVVSVTPPVDPVSAPVSNPIDVPLLPTQTTDAHRTNLPITFLQDIPSPCPGEGSSRQTFGHTPFVAGGSQFMPQSSRPYVVPTVAPFTAPPSMPSSEPFLWTSPPIMPWSDPYHPYYVGQTTEDILVSLMVQHDALTRRIQVLESAPPCRCQTPFGAPHPPRPLSPDSDARFWIYEQQIAYLLRAHHAMEEDWLHMRRLFYSHFPPPPPPSA